MRRHAEDEVRGSSISAWVIRIVRMKTCHGRSSLGESLCESQKADFVCFEKCWASPVIVRNCELFDFIKPMHPAVFWWLPSRLECHVRLFLLKGEGALGRITPLLWRAGRIKNETSLDVRPPLRRGKTWRHSADGGVGKVISI